MALQTNATKLANLFDPEVVGARIEKKLFKNIKFAPLAQVYSNLVGSAGSTVTLPTYNKIGDAEVVAEGGAIPIKKLTEDTVEVSIHKVGIGVEFTDEALLSGYGDPLGEGLDQMGKAIADKVDDEVLAELAKIVTSAEKQDKDGKYVGNHITLTATFKPDDVADALVSFGEDIEGRAVLIVDAAAYAILRKSTSWIPNTEMGANIIMSGVVGSIYGCQVVVSDKITTDYYIVRPGALAIYLKRDIMVETDRNIINKSTIVTADKHFVAYLLNSGLAIRITKKASGTS